MDNYSINSRLNESKYFLILIWQVYINVVLVIQQENIENQI